MNTKKEKIIAVVGPTASGKSALGVEIAERYEGEIISADSRQVYSGLDIGSGKITKDEMKGIPHHMLDMADPMDTYSVSDFVREATFALEDILRRNKIPLIVGGTFFYSDALIYGWDLPEVPPNQILREELESMTLEELVEMLEEKDTLYSERVDTENKRRVIRALEIIEAGESLEPLQKESPYDVLWVGIETDEALRVRIEERFDARIKGGMIEEVERLLVQGVTYSRLQELGLEYAHISSYLLGKIDKEEMKETILSKSWQYSRRQLTWLRKNKNIEWFPLSKKEEIFIRVGAFLHNI